jgi:hypothetical protein
VWFEVGTTKISFIPSYAYVRFVYGRILCPQRLGSFLPFLEACGHSCMEALARKLGNCWKTVFHRPKISRSCIFVKGRIGEKLVAPISIQTAALQHYCIGSYIWVFQETSASDHDTDMDDSGSDIPGDDAIYPADMHGSTLLTGLAESDGDGMLCSSTTRATS